MVVNSIFILKGMNLATWWNVNIFIITCLEKNSASCQQHSLIVKNSLFLSLKLMEKLNHNLDTCTSLLIATLLIITKYWNQLTNTMGDWLKHGMSQNGFICNCKKISHWRFLTMPKNAQTTAQLHSSHTLVK